ncbi:hypothetical protein HG530_000295 [Fusarium avenaceum]|nr:hypothetical protein HG530_000295 [Fusarium avenaceum]
MGGSYLVFTVNSISAIDTTSSSRTTSRIVVAPAGTTLAIGTIASHMACVSTDTADDAGSEVLFLRAVVLAMTNLATVLASLVLIVSQGTVECGEFSKLVALENVDLLLSLTIETKNHKEFYLPIAVSWDDVVDAKLLGDFLDSQVQRIGLELLACHVGQDGSGQAHETSGLVLGCITPSVSLLSSSRSVRLAARLGIASTLQVAINAGVVNISAIEFLLIAETAFSQGDVVGTRDSLASPRHFRRVRDQC